MAIGTRAEVDQILGTATHVNPELYKRLAYVTSAGSPAGVVTPEFVGQECFDTTNSDWYRSTGAAAGNWKKLTP
jgi:hypothetical protein